MERFFTYALYSDSCRKLYIGHTNNLERRLKQHNSGRVGSTKPYRPYRLLYFEEMESKAIAVKRERKLKLTSGRRFLKRFIK